jgi:hypothetical protein
MQKRLECIQQKYVALCFNSLSPRSYPLCLSYRVLKLHTLHKRHHLDALCLFMFTFALNSVLPFGNCYKLKSCSLYMTLFCLVSLLQAKIVLIDPFQLQETGVLGTKILPYNILKSPFLLFKTRIFSED